LHFNERRAKEDGIKCIKKEKKRKVPFEYVGHTGIENSRYIPLTGFDDHPSLRGARPSPVKGKRGSANGIF
jgi:hypothetical protein